MGIVGKLAKGVKSFFDPMTVGAIVFSLTLALLLMYVVRMKTFMNYVADTATDGSLPYLYAISQTKVSGNDKTLYECLSDAVKDNSEEACGKNLTKYMYEEFGEIFILYNSSGSVVFRTNSTCKKVGASIPIPRGGLLVICHE